MSEKHLKITLNLDGKVSPADFQRGVKDFFDLVQAVAADATGDPKGIRWHVAVRSGSNLIDAIGTPSQERTEEDVDTVVTAIGSGVAQLNAGTSVAPRFFSERALEHAKRLSLLAANGAARGLETVEIRSNGDRHPVSVQVAASVQKVMGGFYYALGSVEGRLLTISGRDGLKIVVYDTMHDKRVECIIADENQDLLEKALHAFRRRVGVFGTIKYRDDGQPVSIRVDDLHVFREKADLPTIREMRGFLRRAS